MLRWKRSCVWVEKPPAEELQRGELHGVCGLWSDSGSAVGFFRCVTLCDFCGTQANLPHAPRSNSSPDRESCRIYEGRRRAGAGLKMCWREAGECWREAGAAFSRESSSCHPSHLEYKVLHVTKGKKKQQLVICWAEMRSRKACQIVAYQKALVITDSMDHKYTFKWVSL